MFDVQFDWSIPYRWRTNLRCILPRPLCWVVNKGTDCEAVGADHDWYNMDDESSACYHCQVTKAGQLWRESDSPPATHRLPPLL
jgi:hypothetical protein